MKMGIKQFLRVFRPKEAIKPFRFKVKTEVFVDFWNEVHDKAAEAASTKVVNKKDRHAKSHDHVRLVDFRQFKIICAWFVEFLLNTHCGIATYSFWSRDKTRMIMKLSPSLGDLMITAENEEYHIQV